MLSIVAGKFCEYFILQMGVEEMVPASGSPARGNVAFGRHQLGSGAAAELPEARCRLRLLRPRRAGAPAAGVRRAGLFQ